MAESGVKHQKSITQSINISIISWWSVLLVEEIGVSGENHQPVTSH
jgi:hypothetical protein